MLLAYEVGIVVLGPDAVHNGAAVWLTNVLGAIGLGQYVLLPVITCAMLIGWHYMLRRRWKFSPWVLLGMFLESIVWAAVIWGAFRGYRGLLGIDVASHVKLAPLLGFFGAGIYEELLFRVLLLSSIAAVMRQAGAPHRASLVTAVLISALVFACAHYSIFVAGGAPFTWSGIAFHAILGAYFGTLFSLRGFGITAGAHALYNVAVMLLQM